MERIRKITAWITIIVIIGLIIGTLICAVTGSAYFFGMLALSFFVPIILWVFMWFTKLVSGNQKMTEEGENIQSDKE